MGRFHTGNGEFVGWPRLPNGLISIAQAVVRKVSGHIPRKPWIPSAARAAIEREIQRDWIVWEIGAGFSTLWLAERAHKVISIEPSREWLERLQRQIHADGRRNIDLRFEWVASRMADFSELSDESLDLLFIDGGPRALCLEHGFAKVRKDGFVYLDNWDSKHFWPATEAFLAARTVDLARHQHFIDYVPGQFGVYEGLLIQKRPASA